MSPPQYKLFFFGYSINMQNLQQNNIQNEIEQIKKETDLLRHRLKRNKKSQNQFQNELMHIKKMQVEKGQKQDFFQTK